MGNKVWVLEVADSIDLNPHIAVFDSEKKAREAFTNVMDRYILDLFPDPIDENGVYDDDGMTRKECIEHMSALIFDNYISVHAVKLNDENALGL